VRADFPVILLTPVRSVTGPRPASVRFSPGQQGVRQLAEAEAREQATEARALEWKSSRLDLGGGDVLSGVTHRAMTPVAGGVRYRWLRHPVSHPQEVELDPGLGGLAFKDDAAIFCIVPVGRPEPELSL
jgi:hypothetical protein